MQREELVRQALYYSCSRYRTVIGIKCGKRCYQNVSQVRIGLIQNCDRQLLLLFNSKIQREMVGTMKPCNIRVLC